jgi:hypothetical protein
MEHLKAWRCDFAVGINYGLNTFGHKCLSYAQINIGMMASRINEPRVEKSNFHQR